ncbi:MAG: hydrogenase nickel incorporation protein HypB [Anaerolineae bacterium]|nr:hydrogenase nickel incorporation protein HypB [Anaerolineae bacterium]MDW8068816.1 hydrogenase nickel incorporation protein HypB [Anaerolineae bacterium]
MSRPILVVEHILSANDRLAEANRARLDAARVFAVNLMASPGAGKTSLILQTIGALKGRWRIAVVEGDLASTIDADRIAAEGVPSVQIATGGECHLDAAMIQSGLDRLPLDEVDLLIVENVGNLVCPAEFRLGVHRNVLIASVPEGDDKPYKYPPMYRGVDAVILNKIDVLSAFDFNMEYFRRGIEALNPGAAFFPLSCKTGEGVDRWLDWLEKEMRTYREG